MRGRSAGRTASAGRGSARLAAATPRIGIGLSKCHNFNTKPRPWWRKVFGR
jgi:hypothetical protein